MSLIRKALFGQPTQKAMSVNHIDFRRLIQNDPVVFYNYDRDDFMKKGYAGNAEVYKIVRKIVDKASIADLYLYIETDNKYTKFKKHRYSSNPIDHVKKNLYVAKALEYADENSDLAKLIANPNDTQTWADLSELRRIFYYTQGECFMVRETEIGSDIATSLHVLPANRVQHMYNHIDNKIEGWVVDWGKGLKQTFKGDDLKDVFHMKMANPLFDEYGEHLRGMSPLMAGLKYLQLDDVSIEAWVKSMENEGAKGIVSPNHADPKLWLNKDQVETTEKALDKKIHGFQNRNKIAVSGMPLQYQQIGMSPDALNIIEGMREAQINLCDLWGLPPELFATDNTHDNQREASARFLTEVILPFLDKEEDALNKWLVDPFRERDGKNYVLDYDTSMYEELKPTFEQIEAMARYSTTDEMRILFGYDAYDINTTNPAEMIFIEGGKVPINDFGI